MRTRSLACGVWTLMLCAAIGCGGDDGDGMTAGDGGMAGTAGMVGGGSGGAAGSGGNSGDGGTVGGGSGGVGGDAGSAGTAGCDQPIEQVPDVDADGFGDRDATPSLVCPGTSGWTERATDCDDDNNAVHPEASEVCDDTDNNCDDVIDEDLRLISWPDSDMDGFGDASADAYDACIVPPGHATNNEDCGDDDPLVHPGAATERCDGVDTNCDGSMEEIMVPSESIEDAVAMAAVGQWICIAPGTYSGTVLIDKQVVLVGAGEEPGDTILDGERGGSVITVASQGSGTEIRNLTVTNGGTGWGGGIHFLGHGSLDHVIVEDNHCVGACRGGGVYGSYARNIAIRHSIIRNNTTTATPSAQFNYGAGIYVDGNLTLEDSVVEGNVATGANGMSSIQVWGGGLHIDGGQGTLRRVSFLRNEARDGNAVGGGAISTRTTVQLEHVDMRGNSAYGGYVYGTALVTRGGTTNATNIVAAGNHGAATDMFGNAFGTIAATGTGGIALNLTNATLYQNSLSAMNEVRGCALTASGTEATLSFNNVIIESHVCGGGSLIHASHTTPAGSYTSEHDNNVAPGFAGLLTDSASFEDTTGNVATTWDLRLTNSSALRNAGDPAILDPDGSRSTLGAYGGPGGNWATP